MIDLIKFTHPTIPTDFSVAQAVDGYDSVTWIERYRKPGEVKITGPLSSGIREALPLGAYVSHQRTFEVCMIEDHYIRESPTEDPIIEITGRSLEAQLENRILGMGADWSAGFKEVGEYILASNYTWQHASTLIREHINFGVVWNTIDEWQNIRGASWGPFYVAGGNLEERTFPRQDVHSALMDVLAIEDLGIKVVRRHDFVSKYFGYDAELYTQLWIHEGLDNSGNVIFSPDSGEVASAEYLWSNKPLKNVALVTGPNLEVLVEGESPAAEYEERRVMMLDAGDLDKDYESGVTSNAARDAMLAKMVIRGEDALAAQRQITMQSVDISKDRQYTYRDNYDIGDLVTVLGDYGQSAVMRIVEYAEIEDQTSFVGYPTLALP